MLIPSALWEALLPAGRGWVEGFLKLLCNHFPATIENIGVNSGNNVEFCMARVTQSSLQIAVVEFQLVGGTRMTEWMNGHSNADEMLFCGRDNLCYKGTSKRLYRRNQGNHLFSFCLIWSKIHHISGEEQKILIPLHYTFHLCFCQRSKIIQFTLKRKLFKCY